EALNAICDYTNWIGDNSNTYDLTAFGDFSLPVELQSFTAKAGNGKVELNWTTASEIDNAGFAILRSLQKENEYEEIDSYRTNDALKGAGNSSTTHQYKYIDQMVGNGMTYWYKLVDVDYNGVRLEHGPVCASPNASEVNIDPVSSSIPAKFSLAQNYPNPFNPSTHISFDIPELKNGLMNVKITVYDMLGKNIKTLLESPLAAGPYEIEWDGMNEFNRPVPSGLYICQLQSALFNAQIKMVLMK
ncbi:MAG: FlgD immunoglobulin-like domain containing protein, partial [Calditrichaceae bacterium]